MLVEAWFDGCCEPKNPGGHAAWGAVVRVDGQDVYREGGYVGVGLKMSNNVAEYSGWLALATYINQWLERQQLLLPSLIVRGDSKLVINQLAGAWNVNCTKCGKPLKRCTCYGQGLQPKPTPGLYYPYYLQAVEQLTLLKTRIKSVNLVWIPREQNDVCDVLSKQILHEMGVEFKIQPEKPVRR